MWAGRKRTLEGMRVPGIRHELWRRFSTVVLRASQDGNDTYPPAPNVEQVLSVAPGNNPITDFQNLANGMFTFRFYGEPGINYVLQDSTNLVNWLPLTTNQVSSLGYIEFTNIFGSNQNRRFYQALVAP